LKTWLEHEKLYGIEKILYNMKLDDYIRDLHNINANGKDLIDEETGGLKEGVTLEQDQGIFKREYIGGDANSPFQK